jgi:hypothetical protein
MEMIATGLPTSGHANSTNRTGFFGKRLSEYFGVESDKLLEVNRHGKLALVVTRLTCSGAKKIGGSLIAPVLHALETAAACDCPRKTIIPKATEDRQDVAGHRLGWKLRPERGLFDRSGGFKGRRKHSCRIWSCSYPTWVVSW